MSDAPPPPAPSPRQSRRKTSGAGMNPRWIVGGVLLVLAVIFVLENRDPVAIRLIIPLVVMPQWAALTVTLVIGLVAGALLARRRR